MTHCWGTARPLYDRPLSNAKESNPQTSHPSLLFPTVLYRRMLYLLLGRYGTSLNNCYYASILFCLCEIHLSHRTSIAGVAQTDGLGLESWKEHEILFFYKLHKDCETHTSNYWTDTCFGAGKAGGAWRWPLPSTLHPRYESVELYLWYPYTPSWFSARTTAPFLTFTLNHS